MVSWRIDDDDDDDDACIIWMMMHVSFGWWCMYHLDDNDMFDYGHDDCNSMGCWLKFW